MRFTYPMFYDKNLPPSFANQNPVMASVLTGRQDHVTKPPYQQRTEIKTKGGEMFITYAKAGGFEAGWLVSS